MANAHVKVKAKRTFAHGNLQAREGGVYEMVRAEAQELEKAGFVSLNASGDVEGTQVLMPAAKPAPGDVVADDAPDILGAKMEDAVKNKMDNATANKRSK